MTEDGVTEQKMKNENSKGEEGEEQITIKIKQQGWLCGFKRLCGFKSSSTLKAAKSRMKVHMLCNSVFCQLHRHHTLGKGPLALSAVGVLSVLCVFSGWRLGLERERTNFYHPGRARRDSVQDQEKDQNGQGHSFPPPRCVIPSHSSHVFQMTIISLRHLSFTTR